MEEEISRIQSLFKPLVKNFELDGRIKGVQKEFTRQFAGFSMTKNCKKDKEELTKITNDLDRVLKSHTAGLKKLDEDVLENKTRLEKKADG